MDYDHLYNLKKQMYFGNERRELLPYIPENLKIVLDVGCGSGAFGTLLKTHCKCIVWGIEPNKPASLVAEKKLDKVINSMFSNDLPELQGRKFDAIFFNDVLEHLLDPSKALNNCKELLRSGGYIISSIPNIRWYPVMLSLLRYKDFKYEESGVMDKTHLRFFTSKSMIRLFEESNYKVICIEGINENKNFTFFNILNRLLFGRLKDMKYPQFIVVAQLNIYAH